MNTLPAHLTEDDARRIFNHVQRQYPEFGGSRDAVLLFMRMVEADVRLNIAEAATYSPEGRK